MARARGGAQQVEPDRLAASDPERGEEVVGVRVYLLRPTGRAVLRRFGAGAGDDEHDPLTLRDRSLLTLTTNDKERIELHDLIHDYLRLATPDPRPLHAALLTAYRARCPDGWPSGPDDG